MRRWPEDRKAPPTAGGALSAHFGRMAIDPIVAWVTRQFTVTPAAGS